MRGGQNVTDLLLFWFWYGQCVDEEVDLLRLADQVDDKLGPVRCDAPRQLQLTCERVGVGVRTVEYVLWVVLVWIAVLRYWDIGRELLEVCARVEVLYRARHDR